MLIIGNVLVSEDFLTRKFCCAIAQCHGDCCVEGDAGAPLEKEEIDLIARDLEKIRPFVSHAGMKTLEQEGFYIKDPLGAIVTTLNKGKECVFTVFEDQTAVCAIEQAYHAGQTQFQKPISCHLYPVRMSELPDHEAINLHEWPVCRAAWDLGKLANIPVYEFLREPLIRKFGEAWYEELVETAEAWAKLHPAGD